MNALLAALAQQPPAAGLPIWVPILGVLAVMYFVVLRPQRQDQLKYEAMLKNLAKYDEVLTTGGVIGTIVAILDNDRLTLKVDDKTDSRLTLHRAYVRTVLKKSGKDAKDATDAKT